MRTLFLVRCSMCRRMMPNFVDCFGYQSRTWTSPPQKYLQSLALEVSTDTCPCPQLQHLLPPSPPPGNWFQLTHAHVLNYNTFSLRVLLLVTGFFFRPFLLHCLKFGMGIMGPSGVWRRPPFVRLGFCLGASTNTCQHRGRIGRRNIDFLVIGGWRGRG